MTVLLALVLAAPVSFLPIEAHAVAPSWALSGVALDDGDEDAAVIAGYAKRGLDDFVVREARTYLQTYPSHRRAPSVRYLLAGALYDLGRKGEAIAEYEVLDGIAGFGQSTEVKFRLGQCSMDLGKFAEAAGYLDAATAGAKRNPKAAYLLAPASYLKAESLFRAERFPEAKDAYKAVLALEKSGGEYARDARYGVAWSHFEAGDFAGTVKAAEAFLREHPTDAEAGDVAFIAGESLVANGKPEEALGWYARVKSGRYVEAALRGAAFAEVERDDFQRAAARFSALLDRFPDSEFAAEAALQAGVQRVRARDFSGALQALGHPAAPKDAQTSYWTAAAHAGLEQHEAAYNAARKGLDRGPDEALAVQLRIAAGDALYELGREAEAAALYEASGSAYALHAAAVAKLNAGDAREAARLAETLLNGASKAPGSAYRGEALLTRAEALFRLKEYAAAEAVLRRLMAEVTPVSGGAAAATTLEAAEVARARARLGWCRWYDDDAGAARGLFTAVARDGEARPAVRQEAAFMAARAALEEGDEAAARTGFAGYLGAAPRGPFAAEANLRLGRLTPGAEGARYFETVATDFASSELAPAALSELADRRVALGDAAGAAEAYRTITERFPDDPLAAGARYGLGWARYNAGDFEGAATPLWEVASTVAAEPSLRAASLELLVWVEAGAKDVDGVKRAFAGLLTRVEDGERLMKAARAADAAMGEAGDADGRAAHWKAVADRLQGPARGQALIERGFVALDGGDAEEAARHALGARRILPEDAGVAELLYFIGEAYFEKGDDDKAAPLFAAASAHGSPEVAERALYKSGFAELRRGKNGDAGKAFAALVERFPRGVLAPESMFLAGEASFRDGRFEDAAGWLRRMTQGAPKHASRPKALFRLGVAEGELGNWKAASSALAELLSKTPDFPNAVEAELWRGRALSRQGQHRSARQSLTRVVERDEGILAAQARIEIGRVHEALKDPESAIAEYLKVAVLYGHAEECAEALVRAGDALAGKGDAKLAKARYEEVVSDYPKTAWAEEARKRLAGSQ